MIPVLQKFGYSSLSYPSIHVWSILRWFDAIAPYKVFGYDPADWSIKRRPEFRINRFVPLMQIEYTAIHRLTQD